MERIGADCQNLINDYLTWSNKTILKAVSKRWYTEYKNNLYITIREIALYDAELIPYIVEIGMKLPKYVHVWIIKNGSLEILEWLESNNYKISDANQYFAVENNSGCLGNIATERGDLKIMKWMYSKHCLSNYWTFILAARNGNLENMKWLKSIDYDANMVHRDTFDAAASNGNLENMKWLKSIGCPFGHFTLPNAAINGNLENMKWLVKEISSLADMNYKSMILEAAYNGNLENMKWLVERGCTLDSKVLYWAAENGNLENIKWLISKGCKFHDITFVASRSGNLDTMKWMLSIGCKIPEYFPRIDIKTGKLENMKWLKEIGCKFTIHTFRQAVEVGNLEVMKWLKKEGCLLNEKTFVGAAINGNLKNMEWLKSNNCPYNKALFLETNGNVETEYFISCRTFDWINNNLK
jgi:ankyrin repeat protein